MTHASMYDPSDYALVTVIEGNGEHVVHNRLLENEAVKCFQAWRAHAGLLKDINIYCICITSNTPSERTIKSIEQLGVKYIHDYDKSTDRKGHLGWWNVPLGCSILEKTIPEKMLIHIDLDMYIFTPLKIDLTTNGCLVYDKLDRLQERTVRRKYRDVITPFNPCFIVSHKNDLIYKKWWDVLLELENEFDKKTILKEYYSSYIPYKYLQTASLDIANLRIKNTPAHLSEIHDIIYGETYTSVDEMTTTNNISFHHYHQYVNSDGSYDVSQYNWPSDRVKFLKNKYTKTNEAA